MIELDIFQRYSKQIANGFDVGCVRRTKAISYTVLNASTSYSFNCHHSDPSHYHLSLEPLQQQIASWLVHLHLLNPFWIIQHSTISVIFFFFKSCDHATSLLQPLQPWFLKSEKLWLGLYPKAMDRKQIEAWGMSFKYQFLGPGSAPGLARQFQYLTFFFNFVFNGV